MTWTIVQRDKTVDRRYSGCLVVDEAVLELELVEAVPVIPDDDISAVENNSTQTKPSTDEKQNMIARVVLYNKMEEMEVREMKLCLIMKPEEAGVCKWAGNRISRESEREREKRERVILSARAVATSKKVTTPDTIRYRDDALLRPR